MNRPATQALACALALLACAPGATRAQDVSRIVAATVYEGGALVERQLHTPGGTRHVTIDCMPPGFTANTLEIDGDPSLHVGDVRTVPVTGDAALSCARGPADARIRALEDQKTALKSQSTADDLAIDYLKRWNGSGSASDAAVGARAAGPLHAVPAADTLRKSAVDLMADQARLAHQVADVDRQLEALQKAIHRTTNRGSWSTLRFDLSTTGAATLRVRYPVDNANWEMSYRAVLDTATSTLHLERQAEIMQSTGEDWTDVALTLSVQHLQEATHPQPPQPWNLNPIQRYVPGSSAGNRNGDGLQRVEVTGASISPFLSLPETPAAPKALDTTPVVGIKVDDQDWRTLFHTTQPISMPSDGEPHMLALDAAAIPVKVRLQVITFQQLVPYVFAEAPAPAGSGWPEGKVQLWRDGALIGDAKDWSPAADDGRLALYFGVDKRLRITVQRPPSMSISVGLFGGQQQRSWGSVFVFTNQHATAQTIELIDPAPVTHDESVKVESTYDPAPTVKDWQHKPGINAWTFALAPNQTSQVKVSHQVTFPKDVDIRDLPTSYP